MPAKKSSSKGSSKKKSVPMQPNVKIYTTHNCPWCIKTKEFLKANNVKYSEVDVAVDEKARNDMFEKSGQFGVPVTIVNKTVVVGFDKEGLKRALGIGFTG